ncbi:hypothetical protein SOVF_129350 isoform B [Spinacia oleracea]|nr:hypothetical protein SOVF_129350 isoform B [Spinacia oleracea]
MVEGIRAKGGVITREPGPVKGGSTVIAFVKVPTGYIFELIQRCSTPEPLCQVMLRVGDLDCSIKFYEKLSFELVQANLELNFGTGNVKTWWFLRPYYLSVAAIAFPPLSTRGDLGVILTAGARYAPSLLKSFDEMGPQGVFGATELLQPFSEKKSFHWVYMFAEWYKPWCVLEYPLHGTGAVFDAMVCGT